MRVLYITEIYPDPKRGIGVWGGGERQFYEISRRVAAMGHEVSVLTCRFPGQPAEEEVHGIKVCRIGLSRDPRTGGVRRAVLPVFSYIVKTAVRAVGKRPELIHCNTYFPVYPGKIASLVKEVPLVTTFHDIYGLRGWIESQHSVAWGFLGHLATTIAARLHHDRIISVSPQCKQKLVGLGVPEDNITIIPNGVDLKLFDSIKVEKIPHQILYVGRLVNFKHVDWLIQAMPQVLKEVPGAKLKVVGGGPEREALVKLVNKLGLQAHVTFTGLTPTYEAVTRYYKESEVFVLPSTVEGEAIVLKEAMAAGLPLIAMNIPGSGVLSLLRDDENGFLLEPGRPELIAEKLIQLLQNEKLRERMGEAGRKFVEQFDWDIIAEQTLQVYKIVIESK
ncbi:MAG: glycosyltransferase family 4 protein [Candidatus Hadarchaeum sp.]|uniref:glycosyltransferase family 4 protein n=1 Tax=Candidatus Hadarchaeum sp. TaxID=2883567 RepID=UPI00317910F7